MTLAQQLTDIYLNCEDWHHGTKLSKEESDKYHQDRINSGNIITVSHNGLCVGYVEFYKDNGQCKVFNLFIRPEYRRGEVIKMLKRRLFEVCSDCKVFFGERNKFGKRYNEFQLRRTL